MKLIDLHCDTIDKLMDYPDECLYENNFSIDINKLKKAESLVQVFALYFDLDRYREDPFSRFENMANRFFKEIEMNKELISLARSYDDITANQKQNKVSAILSIEEGGAINGKIDNLHKIYERGVRLITLNWNYENEIGYPHNSKNHKNKGLKLFGIDVVKTMNELGMIIDVSHLNDGGFYDVAKVSQKPFIASHSNARSITNHSRNLSDDMIKVLANKGGVMGINFCNAFLGDSSVSSIDEIANHIKYIVKIGGIDVVAMGTDFDGILNRVEIENISEMHKLEYKLLKLGFKEEEIEKIMYKNALRVLKDVL
ncbi:MAG: dipeptidase [Peptostreptococcaceae bacterium]